MLGLHARTRFVKFINMGLVAGAGGLVLMLGQSLVGHWSIEEGLSDSEMTVAQHDGQRRKIEPSGQLIRPMPDLSEFQMIVDRDLFRGLPDNVGKVPVVSTLPIPKPPLPPLSVSLSGTIVLGDERKAILKNGQQEEIYGVGQAVAGGILTAVEGDRVVIARGDARTELLLKSAMENGASMLASLPSQGLLSLEKLAGGKDKKNKAAAAGKPLFATPAFARYPGVGTQPKGDYER
jgi:hypothetical protein